MAERNDWPNRDWYGRPTGPSEFSWGPGLVPPGKETAPPSEGGIYRGVCPPVELSPSPDLGVQARQARPKRGDPPQGFPGDPVGR
jgi:hypothetical protein